jgi:hypothetical protein
VVPVLVVVAGPLLQAQRAQQVLLGTMRCQGVGLMVWQDLQGLLVHQACRHLRLWESWSQGRAQSRGHWQWLCPWLLT